MEKAKEKRQELCQQELQSAEKTKAQANRLKKHDEDKLAFLLCGRQCVCTQDVCVWLHHSLCPESSCAALLYPMKPCNTVICRAIKLKKKKEDIESKKAQEKLDRAGFMECKAAHDKNGTRMLTCPCNEAAREDIEVAQVRNCKWEGWHICTNPPCEVLVKPMSFCKRRACAQFRKSQAGPTVPRPRKRASKPAPKKQKVITSAKQQDSDTSSQSDSDSGKEPTPRRTLPRKSSARTTAPKPAPLDGSDTSDPDSDHEAEDSPPPFPLSKPVSPKIVPKTSLTREVTVTLPDEFEVSHIVSGPRKSDGKYNVKWVGYDSDENTWEPRKNLPDSCFDEQLPSSDESGDDRPLVETLQKSRLEPVDKAAAAEVLRLAQEEADNVKKQQLHDAAQLAPPVPSPPSVTRRQSRITATVATRTTFQSNREGMRHRTNRKS